MQIVMVLPPTTTHRRRRLLLLLLIFPLCRDIKPHNVFLSNTSPLIARLGDFGLAGGAEDETRACTPRYAPPEVTLEHTPATAASDVFSFGLVLYEAMTLRRCKAESERRGNALVPPVDLFHPAALATLGIDLLEVVGNATLADPATRPPIGQVRKLGVGMVPKMCVCVCLFVGVVCCF